jgi:archaellum component FlaC
VAKDILSEMKEELENKIEHLQHLKSLISSIAQSVDFEIIAQKRKDVERLQGEIEELEFNIKKLKIK